MFERTHISVISFWKTMLTPSLKSSKIVNGSVVTTNLWSFSIMTNLKPFWASKPLWFVKTAFLLGVTFFIPFLVIAVLLDGAKEIKEWVCKELGDFDKIHPQGKHY
jgi:hypothetical protein